MLFLIQWKNIKTLWTLYKIIVGILKRKYAKFVLQVKTKYYEISICCFSDKHAELRGHSKDWLGRDQENVFATLLPFRGTWVQPQALVRFVLLNLCLSV